jgi:hypothetical protein
MDLNLVETRLKNFEVSWRNAGEKLEKGLSELEADSWRDKFKQDRKNLLTDQTESSQYTEIIERIMDVEIKFFSSINQGIENRRLEENEKGNLKITQQLLGFITKKCERIISIFRSFLKG